MEIKISERRNINIEDIIELYKVNKWSSADKPNELYNTLINSHTLVDDVLVGIGNAFLMGI